MYPTYGFCTIVECPQDGSCIEGSEYSYCSALPYTAECSKQVGTPTCVPGPFGCIWICNNPQPAGTVSGTACHLGFTVGCMP